MWGNEFPLWAMGAQILCHFPSTGLLDAWCSLVQWWTVSLKMFLRSMQHINISIEYTSAQAPWREAGGSRCGVKLEKASGTLNGFDLWACQRVFFGALDWINACHTHVMPSLPDEPRSAAINSIFASKCIYLICEPMTVSLDLWS